MTCQQHTFNLFETAPSSCAGKGLFVKKTNGVDFPTFPFALPFVTSDRIELPETTPRNLVDPILEYHHRESSLHNFKLSPRESSETVFYDGKLVASKDLSIVTSSSLGAPTRPPLC